MCADAQADTHGVMGRLLTLLLIVLVAISHGPVGTGAAHFDGSDHAIVQVGPHLDTHHGTEAEVDMAQAGDSEKLPQGTGHHVHVASDVVPPTEFVFLDRRLNRTRQVPGESARLHSAILAPLSEPPSA